MTLHAVLLLAGIFALAAAVPGPCMIAISARAAQAGFGRAMVLAMGVGTGDMCFLLLTAFGLGWVAQEMAPAFTAIRFAGAAYLFWLGFRALTARGGDGGQASRRLRSFLGDRGADYVGGLATCLSNPKVILFYGSVLPAFVDMSALTAVGLLEAAATIWVVLMAVCAAYAYAASRLGRCLSGRGSGRVGVWLRRATGLVFVGCGVAVARQ